MVQIFPEDRTTKCTLFEDSFPVDGLAKCFARRSQPKRPRVSTKPTKEAFDDEYFVMICLSGAEPPQIKSSPSLKLHRDYIIGEALTRFLDCIGRVKNDSTSPVEAQQCLATPATTSIPPEAPCISYPFARRAKRRRSNSSVTPTASDPGDNIRDEDSDSASRSPEKLISLSIGNREQCREFFLLGFQAIQQIDCRFLAKRWIKKIEPKKQVHHPYNGGKRDPKDPEATKPQWWPIGMTHKEPDHINKSDRITLLTHLIMHTGTDLLVSVDTGAAPMVKDLEEVTKPYVGELKNPKSWSILQDIFTTRRYMELVELEGNDPEMYHKMVVDRSSDTRRAQGESKQVIDDDDPIEGLEPRCSDAEDDDRADPKAELTPNSSAISSPVIETQPRKDHVMRGMDYQDRLLYDAAPPTRLMMKSNYSGQLPLIYSDLVNDHPNLQGIPPYESSSLYAHGQALEHHLYQRTNGPVPGLPQRAEFSTHTINSLQSSSMNHWPVTGPPGFGFPTQYQGLPSQAPTIQSTTSEQSVLDDGTFQVHQQDQNQTIHYNMSLFDHQVQTGFSEAREMSTPRWSHLPYRPASSNQIPISHLNEISLPPTSEQMYQARLRDLSDFE